MQNKINQGKDKGKKVEQNKTTNLGNRLKNILNRN